VISPIVKENRLLKMILRNTRFRQTGVYNRIDVWRLGLREEDQFAAVTFREGKSVTIGVWGVVNMKAL